MDKDESELYGFMREIEEINEGKLVSSKRTITLGRTRFYYDIRKEDKKLRIDLTPVPMSRTD